MTKRKTGKKWNEIEFYLYSRCEFDLRMMFSRNVFCGATNPRRPPGIFSILFCYVSRYFQFNFVFFLYFFCIFCFFRKLYFMCMSCCWYLFFFMLLIEKYVNKFRVSYWRCVFYTFILTFHFIDIIFKVIDPLMI